MRPAVLPAERLWFNPRRDANEYQHGDKNCLGWCRHHSRPRPLVHAPLGLQDIAKPFEKLRLGLVQAYVQERVRLLRRLAVKSVDELAAAKSTNFIQQRVKFLLATELEDEEAQSLRSNLRRQSPVLLGRNQRVIFECRPRMNS